MSDFLKVMQAAGWITLFFAASFLYFGILMFAGYTHDTAVITVSEKEFGSSVGHVFTTDGEHYVVPTWSVYGRITVGKTYSIQRATNWILGSKNIDSATEI